MAVIVEARTVTLPNVQRQKFQEPPDIPLPLVRLAVHALYSTPLPYVIAALVVPSGGLTLKFCFVVVVPGSTPT